MSLTKDDLESMGYFDAFSTYDKDGNPKSDSKSYSSWVEGKILTEGHERLVENTLGLVGEAGEVAEKIKKLIRDKSRFTPDDIAKELGDVVFYATALANYYGHTLSSVLEINIEKLDGREDRGTLKGSGDNR